MAKPALWELSTVVPATAEVPIARLLEQCWGQWPISYRTPESATVKLSIYLNHRPALKPAAGSAHAWGFKLAQACGLLASPGKLHITRVRREDWAESWKKHFRPLRIGSALLIKPSWRRLQPRPNQAVVVLDPGLSFGTGQHPTTEFCLRQMVAQRDPARTQSLLDLGTGSGILAIAAAKLGYQPVEALDYDAEAVRIARENAKRNHVDGLVRIRQRDLTRLPKPCRVRYSIICANLEYSLLTAEKERILNRLAPAGILVVAGILAANFAEVQKLYIQAGLRLVAETKAGEWHSGAFQRSTGAG